MNDVFISYSRKNKAIAEKLAKALTDHNFTVWWDSDLHAGQQFRNEIQHQAESARCIIVLWSNESLISDWVVNEAELGLRRRKLIPLMLQSGIEQPINFRSLHAQDFSSWEGGYQAKEFESLIKALSILVPQEDRKQATSTEPPPTDKAATAVDSTGFTNETKFAIFSGLLIFGAQVYWEIFPSSQVKAVPLAWDWNIFLSLLGGLFCWPLFWSLDC